MKDSLVKCEVCGRIEQVNFAFCLNKGWPQCHGYTMTLAKTKADIDKAVGSCFGYASISVEVEASAKEKEK